jgi:hypothetical protein
MKKKLIQIMVATILLASYSSAPLSADGGMPPLCYPNPCTGGNQLNTLSIT